MSALTESELAREARKILRKLLAGAHLERDEDGRYGVVSRARAARYAKTKVDAKAGAVPVAGDKVKAATAKGEGAAKAGTEKAKGKSKQGAEKGAAKAKAVTEKAAK